MALIKCPNCGEEISDKAIKCPKCGAEFPVEKPQKICKECGEVLEDDETICHKCGCPIEEKKELVVANKKISLSKIIIAVVVILAVIVCAWGIKSNNQKKAEQKAAEEAKKQQENYENTFKEAVLTMVTGASDAEDAGNLIHDVWYDSIYKNRNEENTKKYVMDDFNDSLSALFSDSSFKEKLSSIESNKDSVNDLMKELKNPPDEYKEAYDELKDLYDSYLNIVNIATDPSGSLQTYTSNFNSADSDVAQKIQSIQIYIQ